MTTNEDYHWINSNEPTKEIPKKKIVKKFTDEKSAKEYLLKVAMNQKLSDFNMPECSNYIDLANQIWDNKSHPFMRGQCNRSFCEYPSDCTAADGCLK